MAINKGLHGGELNWSIVFEKDILFHGQRTKTYFHFLRCVCVTLCHNMSFIVRSNSFLPAKLKSIQVEVFCITTEIAFKYNIGYIQHIL